MQFLKKYFLRLAIACFLFLPSSYSQTELELIYTYGYTDEDPEWVKEMYANNPNPDRVIKLYEAYYIQNEFVKNQHTQYYKRWLRSIAREVVPKPEDRSYLEQSLQLRNSRNLDWECIGPFDWDHHAAGRSYAPGSAHVYTVVQSLNNPDVIYAGTATTGIWKSTNRGEFWIPLTEDRLFNECYSLAIHPENENIVVADMLGSIYKTTDGGITWNPTGDASFQALNLKVKDIQFHPTDHDIIMAATSGGLYRTMNGGTHWTQVDSGDFLELEFQPGRPESVYAVRRNGDNTQFFRSSNTGQSFSQVGNGWPVMTGSDHQRRTELAVTPAAPNRVYALLTGSANGGSGLYGVYISEDRGENWTFSCCGPQPAGPPSASNPNLMGWDDQGLDDGGQYYYDLAFDVDPNNANHILVGGVNLWVSQNGGTSFTCPAKWSHPYKPNYVHADIHDIRFFEHTGEIWIASDGGIFVSTDGGASYVRKMNGIEGTDFWGFGQGHWFGDVMLGGAYHNGTLLKEDDVYINGWLCTDGGDGTLGFVNPGIDRQVYSWFDIKMLQGDRTIAPVTRTFQFKPNNTYITGRSNDMCFHPNYYTTWYSGHQTRLMKTEDNGYSFTEIHDFGEDIASMDICRGNPDVIYLCTYESWWGEKRIYRTFDGGDTWTEITPPTSQISTNRWVPYQIRVHESDPMKAWMVRTSMYSSTNLNGNMVYYTENGGITWQNISGPAMNGQAPTSIFHQHGTDGGVYIGTRRAVYYKDNQMSDWQLINSGMPLSTHSTRMLPYYRKSKIRNATNRSVWERDFVTTSQPVATISVEKKRYSCVNEVVKFVDNSVVTDENVSWQWSFPGAVTPESTERAPEVLYTAPGTYDVTLLVQDAYGMDSVTMNGLIQITDQCKWDTIPGKAIGLNGSGDYVQVNDFDLNTNEMTISAWIKPIGIQSDYAGIVMNDNGNAAGLNFRPGNNMLGYHWPGGEWSWNSGLIVPQNQWSHVAMTVSPQSIKIYLNGQEATHNRSLAEADYSQFKIGSYRGWGGRNFRGEIENVIIWNRTLSRDEIREWRHLAPREGQDSSIVAYYHFNEDEGPCFNGVDFSNTGQLNAGAERIKSTVPIGSGTSERKTIQLNAYTDFEDPGLKMWFSSSPAPTGGEVVVSKLNVAPDTLTLVDRSFDRGYWIINNYSNTSLFNEPDTIEFYKTATISQFMSDNDLPEAKLLYRAENQEGPLWSEISSVNNSLTPGMYGAVKKQEMQGFNRFGQLLLGGSELPYDFPKMSIHDSENERAEIEGGQSVAWYSYYQYKGIKLPEASESQLETLGAPAAGALIYHTELKKLIFYHNTESAWKIIKSTPIFVENRNNDIPNTSGIGLGVEASGSASLHFNEPGFVMFNGIEEGMTHDIETPVEGLIAQDAETGQTMIFDGHNWRKLAWTDSNISVSISPAINVDGITLGEGSKDPNVSLFANMETALFRLPICAVEDIALPVEALSVFDPLRKAMMFFNGQNWEQCK
jgi:photosystem II stability/assembly factor-like uncharacterized protein/PKD repeat protein